jgi:hypothetical protein
MPVEEMTAPFLVRVLWKVEILGESRDETAECQADYVKKS